MPDQLEPVDDVMKRLTEKYGEVAAASKYLFNVKGQWRAVPLQRRQSKQRTMRPDFGFEGSLPAWTS